MSLIIVESPTKARTFNRILKGKEYYVFATMGHIRDLPSDKMAVDFANKFRPDYINLKGREKIVEQLKKLAKKNDEIILASDLDREGEAISYHIAYLLGFIDEKWPDFTIKKAGKKKLSRIVFHEITPKALEEALSKPEELRPNLVKAQQARRILDRVVGYKLSPLLWKKLGKNWLSAGRVQTVALRLVVEREKEITAFGKEPYFQIYANLNNGQDIRAKLIAYEDTKYEIKETIKLFDGEYTFTKTTIDEKQSKTIESELRPDSYRISDFVEREATRFPPPPFTTSLLQQEAFRRFGFSSKMTMRLAQNLYERGLITYHRTDSFNLSSQFVFGAKRYIEEQYGSRYSLEKPRGFRGKSRLTQEAHEAIRPTSLAKTPKEISAEKKLTTTHKKLYDLIFARAIATQMKEASINEITLTVTSGKGYIFEAEFSQIIFDGFLKVLNPVYAQKQQESIKFKVGESLKLVDLEVQENQTQPPPRYNEATLIKTLEEKGIGRPSTYAPIISLIQEKLYIAKEGRYFIPSALGTAISDYLSDAFPSVFDVNFTATMEERLDEIAAGRRKLVTELDEFYGPFEDTVVQKSKDTGRIDVKDEVDEACPNCGKPLQMRFSKFGKFIACSGYPACKYTRSVLKKVEGRKCPQCEGDIVVRYSRKKKRFYGCANYPKCTFTAFTFKQLKQNN